MKLITILSISFLCTSAYADNELLDVIDLNNDLCSNFYHNKTLKRYALYESVNPFKTDDGFILDANNDGKKEYLIKESNFTRYQTNDFFYAFDYNVKTKILNKNKLRHIANYIIPHSYAKCYRECDLDGKFKNGHLEVAYDPDTDDSHNYPMRYSSLSPIIYNKTVYFKISTIASGVNNIDSVVKFTKDKINVECVFEYGKKL